MTKFLSLDSEARTATFEVNGNQVTRNIPEFFVGTIDDYLYSLAAGLDIEFSSKEEIPITETSLVPGQEIV